jgi:hypothetical protein
MILVMMIECVWVDHYSMDNWSFMARWYQVGH